MGLFSSDKIKWGQLIFPQEKLAWSAQHLKSQVELAISELKQKGATSGSVLFTLLPNSSRLCRYTLAAWWMNMEVIPFSCQSSLTEVKNILEEIKPDFFLDQHSLTTAYAAKTPITKVPTYALKLFTSGTTGKPKPIAITAEQLIQKIQVYQKYLPVADFAHTLCFLPLSFGHGLISNFLFPLLSGQKVYLIDGYDLSFFANFKQFLNVHPITFFSTVPAGLRMIVKLGKNSLPHYADSHFHQLKRIHCASAPLDESLWHETNKFFGKKLLHQVYGLTEMLSWVTGEDTPSPYFKAGCVGSSWDAEITLSDTVAGVGEILLKAPYQTTNPGEVLRTGDLGLIDEEGHLFLKGRLDDVINLGGQKIYPAEIDQHLIKGLRVSEAMSFGIELNGTWKIISAVVPQKMPATEYADESTHGSAADFDLKSLILKIHQELPPGKRPHDWLLLDELPKNHRGKIEKKKLQEIYLSRRESTHPL